VLLDTCKSFNYDTILLIISPSGGTVLAQILASIPNVLAEHSISVLIRGEEKVAVFEKMGVKPILFNSLDETDFLRKLASEYDSKSRSESPRKPLG
jgi:hypothetical protein